MADTAKIYADLGEIFAEVFMVDEMTLTPALSAKDVKGWDSFKQIEILVAVEERFGIRLNTKEIDALKSVGDLASVIGTKTA